MESRSIRPLGSPEFPLGAFAIVTLIGIAAVALAIFTLPTEAAAAALLAIVMVGAGVLGFLIARSAR